MKKLFKGKKITIMGLGLHGGGVGVARFFAKQGADVLITDLKTKEQLQKSLLKLRGLKIRYFLGGHRADDFISADLVIKNPAVPGHSPYLQIARANKVPIENDISIFFKLCPGQIIGVTGTKGKSTVATLIYHILRRSWANTVLAGNIGVSPLEFLSKIKKNSKVVLELSSFELEDLKESPEIAVVTNILPDHLDRYHVMENYIEAKKPIFKYQSKKDLLILNYDDEEARRLAKEAVSRVYFYSLKAPLARNAKKFAAYLQNNKVFSGESPEPIFEIKKMNIFGEHNISNVLAAISVAQILKTSPENIAKALSAFKGVAYRQEFIKEVRGVKYFNDTAATMPDATAQAIRVFSHRFPKANIYLILGGQNKGLDYEKLAKKINAKIKNVVLLPGTASDEIKKGLAKKVNVFPASSMEKAVAMAASLAGPNDVVVLSPGAASFNLFKNEFDRGDRFNKAVKNLSLTNADQTPSI